MPDYKEVKRQLEVPKGTGIDGYLKTIEAILKQPKVQEIVLRTSGRIEYRRFVKDEAEDQEIRLDLETLMPYFAIRNTALDEVPVGPTNNAAVVIARLFAAASRDGLNPVLIACHPDTDFWQWHAVTTEVVLSREEAYGLPVYPDTQIPQETFLICAAYSKEGRLADIQKSYKITVPRKNK